MSTDGLQAALAAEHAAIYGYGLVGSHLTKAEQSAAAQAEAAHRNRRDTLMLMIAATSATPNPGDAAYDLPFRVTDRASAIKLALELEEGTARVWYQTLAASIGDQRKLAVDALSDCAVRATRWRKAGGISPVTVAFPGRPA